MPADCGDGVLAVGELTRTTFEFPHEGLAFSGFANVRLAHYVGVVPALPNSNNCPRLRIFRPHGLQTRSGYVAGSCNNTNPTLPQTSANTAPMLSFLCKGLKGLFRRRIHMFAGNVSKFHFRRPFANSTAVARKSFRHNFTRKLAHLIDFCLTQI